MDETKPQRGKRGGARAGAGRKPGSINKLARAAVAAAQATGKLPHEILLGVARGEDYLGHKPTFDQSMQAARDAAPYYAPKIAAIEQHNTGGRSHEEALDELE